MQRFICLILGLAITVNALAQDTTANLMPWPTSVTWGQGKYRLTKAFSVVLRCDPSDDILSSSTNRIFQGLVRKSGLVTRQGWIQPTSASAPASLTIRAATRAAYTPRIDESYTLRVNEQGITVDAPNSIGAIRGLETLQQLLMRDEQGYYLPHVAIADKPRFWWRGLMIDVARHFIPMDVLKRNVDAMATVKMNVLHLHLTDDEGFRIESKKYPLFHQKGSNGQYYTQEEMKGLIEYARLRGIMIVPEFDMPGHTRSWFAGYPQLASAPGPYQPGPRFTLGENDTTINLAAILSAPSPTIDPTREEVYTLLGGLIAEMAALFPAPYLHIGADENNGAAWRQNPKIMAFMQQKGFKDTHALQAYFVSRLYTMVKKQQKTMIGWEELYGPELPKDVVVHKWIAGGGFAKSSGTPAQIASAGNPVLVSVGFYLDHFMPAYVHYLNPSLPADTHPNIWGGVAAQWTEIADAGTIETRIWPRTAAIAERMWSDAQRKDTHDMYRRLFAVSRQLDEQGLQHITSYEQGLRRLSGQADPAALRQLADVLTPLKGYKNLFSRISEPSRLANNRMALASLADILPVDSETKRRFRTRVARYLRSRTPEDASAIRAQLAAWASTHKAISADPALARALGPVMDHAENLSALAGIGQQAMDWIDKGQAIPEADQKAMLSRISSARKPQAETELDITLEIESLVRQQLLPEPAQYSIL